MLGPLDYLSSSEGNPDNDKNQKKSTIYPLKNFPPPVFVFSRFYRHLFANSMFTLKCVMLGMEQTFCIIYGFSVCTNVWCNTDSIRVCKTLLCGFISFYLENVIRNSTLLNPLFLYNIHAWLQLFLKSG